MYLWKDLNRISASLKKSTVKILMLDFDGTLAPIVRYPEKAKLSKETRTLLEKLSLKPNLYLAVISGRQFKDIKEKIGLSNVIYGGNHGLEGEILGEKYLFPISDKVLRTLGRIRKQLNQVSSKFKGTFIEDKGLTLSFHYRQTDEAMVPEIKLLINQTLKPYIKDGLVSAIAGKKIIDITPNVNRNKGDFADLIVRQITNKTKKKPETIAIGDDETDEDVFKHLKNGITIVVGKKSQSKAEYYLKNPREVLKFLEVLNSYDLTEKFLRERARRGTRKKDYIAILIKLKKIIEKRDFDNPAFLEFWGGLIRDVTGRGLGFYFEKVKYFKYGKQSKPDINDKLQLALITSSIKQEQAFLSGLNDRSFRSLRKWLIRLHRKQSYFGEKAQILRERRVSRGEHTQVVIGSILSLAQKYNDSYTNKGTQMIHLPGIDPNSYPMDKWKNNQVIHFYPDPKYFDQYLKIMKSKLEQFVLKMDRKVDQGILEIIASYYQYGVNMHMFENVNQSLFANQANAMLKLLGLKPIEHGIIDFVAMRLQPENFKKYFIDEVNFFN